MRRRSFLSLTLSAAAVLSLPGCGTAAPLAGGLDFVGRYRWRIDHPDFGGWSGIEMRPDGMGFIAVSDRSSIVEGQILRDADGRVTGVDAGPIRPLTRKGGGPVSMDPEGLALTPEGQTYISEEALHRIAVSGTPGQELVFLPAVPGLRDLQRNQSLEALAVAPDGALFTLPEMPRNRSAYPVFRYKGGGWTQPFSIPRTEGWAAVGADFGPDGRFYLLERAFTRLFAFRSRIRVFTFGEDGATEHPVLLETPFRQYGNLEGISVWQDQSGYLRFTMISDDNFMPIGLFTDIVEYRSREPLDPRRLVQ